MSLEDLEREWRRRRSGRRKELTVAWCFGVVVAVGLAYAVWEYWLKPTGGA